MNENLTEHQRETVRSLIMISSSSGSEVRLDCKTLLDSWGVDKTEAEEFVNGLTDEVISRCRSASDSPISSVSGETVERSWPVPTARPERRRVRQSEQALVALDTGDEVEGMGPDSDPSQTNATADCTNASNVSSVTHGSVRSVPHSSDETSSGSPSLLPTQSIFPL